MENKYRFSSKRRWVRMMLATITVALAIPVSVVMLILTLVAGLLLKSSMTFFQVLTHHVNGWIAMFWYSFKYLKENWKEDSEETDS